MNLWAWTVISLTPWYKKNLDYYYYYYYFRALLSLKEPPGNKWTSANISVTTWTTTMVTAEKFIQKLWTWSRLLTWWTWKPQNLQKDWTGFDLWFKLGAVKCCCFSWSPSFFNWNPSWRSARQPQTHGNTAPVCARHFLSIWTSRGVCTLTSRDAKLCKWQQHHTNSTKQLQCVFVDYGILWLYLYQTFCVYSIKLHFYIKSL